MMVRTSIIALDISRRRPLALTAPRLQARAFKVYTRTGDAGSSSLFNGQRRQKDDLVFAALGDTDELNAALGLARAHCDTQLVTYPALSIFPSQIDMIQSRLLDLGSAIATPQSSSNDAQLQRASFDADGEEAQQLEGWIDAMDASLPPLRNFILPSGGLVSASLHVARATCRRAERSVVPLIRENECPEAVGIFLNRLSDYLFVAARYAALKMDHPETQYQKPKPPRSKKPGGAAGNGA